MAKPTLMTHEERRRLIEAPITICVHGGCGGRAGTSFEFEIPQDGQQMSGGWKIQAGASKGMGFMRFLQRRRRELE
jgi:hypothetical protein